MTIPGFCEQAGIKPVKDDDGSKLANPTAKVVNHYLTAKDEATASKMSDYMEPKIKAEVYLPMLHVFRKIGKESARV